MDSKDLRVGNWVLYKNGGSIILDLSDFKEMDKGLLEMIKSLPINDETLPLIGFNHHMESKPLLFSNALRMVRVVDSLYIEDTEGRSHKINYIHEAQNIYHALRGKEIDNKPERYTKYTVDG